MNDYTVEIDTSDGAATEADIDSLLHRVRLYEGTQLADPVLTMGADGTLHLTCQVAAAGALEAAGHVWQALRDAHSGAQLAAPARWGTTAVHSYAAAPADVL